MIQTVEIDVMNGRYTIEANVELKAVTNYIEVDGYRDEWEDYEYVSHEVVSLYDNLCEKEIETDYFGFVEMHLDEIIETAIEQAAKERP